jgi:hypothetical protein
MAAKLERGLLAEFESATEMLAAIEKLRDTGYVALDAYSPYPVPGAEDSLGVKRSPIPLFALIAGVIGGSAAYFLQWWMNAYDYPINVGGRPPHSGLAFVPITFEMTVLFAGVTAFLAVFLLSGLPRLWHPLFEIEGFERATIDRFFVLVAAEDPKFDAAATRKELEALHSLRVVSVGETT